MVAEGKLIESQEPDFYAFLEDTTFSSPSAASSVVAGRNTNGRITWRIDGGGQTYADWHESKLDQISVDNEDD
jgi:hypothetical protein